MGLILAGALSGLGQGMVDKSKLDALSEEKALARAEAADLKRELAADRNELTRATLEQRRLEWQDRMGAGGVGGVGGGGKRGGGAAMTPEQAERLAMEENGMTELDMAQYRQTQQDGGMRAVPVANQPAAADVDPSVGEDGYADRTTRMLQQEATTIGTGMQQDAGLINQYRAQAPQIAASTRKNLQSDNADKIAKLDESNQVGGLVDGYIKGDNRAGEAALIRQGKDAFGDKGSKASGKPNTLGLSEVAENLGQNAKDLADGDKARAETEQLRSGLPTPKDMREERIAIDSTRIDIRKREEALDKNYMLTEEDKRQQKTALADERQALQAREKAWQKANDRPSAARPAARPNAASDTGVNGERLRILQAELDAEANPQTKLMLQREIKRLREGGTTPVNTASMGPGVPQPTTVQAPQAKQSIQAAPPAAQRQAGATYNTPKGRMKWTGTGWLPV